MAPDSTSEPTPTGGSQEPDSINPATPSPAEEVTTIPVKSGASAPSTAQPAEPTPGPQPAAEVAPQSDSVPAAAPAASQNSSAAADQPGAFSPQPGQSVVMGGTAGSPVTHQPAAMDSLPKKRRPLKWVLALVAAVIVLGGGYTFAFYLPNTPGNIYKSGLDNTNRAYDKLVDYTTTTQAKHYKGYQANGSFKLTSASGSGDGTFSAQSDGKNATGQFDADILGAKFSGQYRAITATNQTVPDVYLNITGIKKTLDGFGLPQLGKLDGKWLVIDHTLLETGLADASGNANSKKATAPSFADVKDAMFKLGAVNKKYLFTTDKNTAVLKNEQYLGKSTQDGRQVAGYKVGYDKAHLKAYVTALGNALDGSSLNTWAKQTSGKSLSETMGLQNMQSQIDKAKTDYTFDLYVDTKTKLIHKVHIPDTTDPTNNFMELGLNYTGGSKYPLMMVFASKDGGTATKADLSLTLDSATDKITGNLDVSMSGSSKTTFTMTFNFEPSNKTTPVVAPKGAKSVLEILQSLGLGGLLDASAGSGSANSGAQDAAKDAERQSDITSLSMQIMAYFTNTGSYPTLSQINSSSWRAANMKDLDSESLKDPDGSGTSLAGKPAKHVYAYQASGCSSKGCTGFKLSATLSTGKLFSQSSF